jgi:hypothetical protein
MTTAHKILWVALGFALFAGQCKPAAAQRETAVAAPGFEAHGGFVNFVEGSGRCICSKTGSPQAKQPLINGDIIELDSGRAEIVLAPGYYVRFADHTTVRMLDLEVDNLKIQLIKGSAIVEIVIEPELPFARSDQTREIEEGLFTTITFATPTAEYSVIKAGGYRFDIPSKGASNVRVLKGAVAVSGRTVTSGEFASVMGSAVDVRADAKHVDDAFDSWSRARAETLVQSNKALKQSDWHKKMANGGYLEIPSDKSAGANNAHVVSARGSLAGFIEDGTSIKSAKADWQDLKSGAELSDGDRVRTVPHSRAELLPYPDFDLCLDGNSEINYSMTDDGNVSVTLTRGSVGLVVYQNEGKHVEKNTLRLSVSNSEYMITASGYYRVNIFPDGTSEMLVYTGSVTGPGGEVGAAKRIRQQGQSRTVSAFNKDSRDSFDIWARRRSTLNRYGDTTRRIWLRGLWFLDPATSEYTFVPAELAWKSPYGGSYSTVYLLNRERFRRGILDLPMPVRLPR